MSLKKKLSLKKTTSFYTESEYTTILETLLEQIGNNGRFQKYLLYGFLYPYTMSIPFAIMATMFMVAIPDHNCHVPGRGLTNMTQQQWLNLTIPIEMDVATGQMKYSKCLMYDLPHDYWSNETDSFDLQPWVDDDRDKTNTTTTCTYGWDYDRTWYSQTVPSQENWVCDLDYVAPTTLSTGELGTVAGALVLGHMADRIGRKPVFLIATLIRVVFRAISLLSVSIIPLYLTAVFISATSMPLIYQAPYTLCLEFSSPENRAMVNTVTCVAWVVGMCILPLFVWLARDWMIIGIISIVPILLSLIGYRYMPESLRWLVSQGRADDAAVVLRKVAKVNGKPLPDDYMKTLKKLSRSSTQSSKTYGFITFFQYKKMALTTIALTFCWIINLTGYMALQLNFGNMAGNPFVNNFLLSLIELPAYLSAFFLVNSLGRRWTQSIFLFVEGLCALIVVGVIIYPDLSWLVTALTLAAKFSVTASFYCVYLQVAELFPTCLRSTGMSFIAMVASIFNIAGPYIVYSGTYDVRYPYIILGIMSISGGIAASFLPETLNQTLPETLDDAKSFGRNQSYFSIVPPKRRQSMKLTEINVEETIMEEKTEMESIVQNGK